MKHKTFFWFMLPTCVAMVLFIAIPIVSIFIQSLFIEHQKPSIEIEICDPFGCKKEIGVEIHIGKNSTLKNLFARLGYKIVRMDRVYFGGLTKKDIPRGRHRFLSDKEVSMLKMI